MGRQRDDQQEGQRQLALIAAAILAAPTPAPAGAPTLAAALVGILPIAAFAGGAAIADRIALEVARRVLENLPDNGNIASPYMQLVTEEQLIWRAAYARAASRRLARAYIEGRLDEAVALEDTYFAAHNRRNERRGEKALLVDEAMRAYGEIVSWHAHVRPTSRPHHRAAHRLNWQPLLGAPLQTGGIPGELLHCLCEVGPPIRGARLLR